VTCPLAVSVFLAVLLVPSGTAAQVILSNNGQPFPAIDSTWSKPVRKWGNMRINNNTEWCGALGSGGDVETNRRKNRTDQPDTSYLVTLGAIRALTDSTLWHMSSRAQWTAADRLVVHPYEGTPVTVVGFFEIIRPQSGSSESTNCRATAERDTDWHIALVASTNEREPEAVVVEPTPRTKRRNNGWTPANARQFAIRKSVGGARDTTVPQVRVTGFLMLDPSHPHAIRRACTGNCTPPRCCYRATLWEIHPVTKIEVRRNNAWVNLNDITPP
jgi:hypothetical protein